MQFANSLKVPTCLFLCLFSSFFFLFSNFFNSKSVHCYVRVLYSSLMLMSHCHYTVMQKHQFVNLIITRSNFIVTVMTHVFKFHSSSLRELLTPYYFLFPDFILHLLLSRKCIIIHISLLLSCNVPPTVVQFHYINLITFLP